MDNHNEEFQKTNISPVAAGITGFILGVVGTAAIAMSDKKTRAQVTQKANDIKDSMEKWSKDTLHELKEAGMEVKKQSETQSTNPADDAKQRLEEALRENKKEL